MHKLIGQMILIGALLLAPSQAFAQGNSYEVPPTPFTAFLSHPHYNEPGPFAGFAGLYWKTNQPLGSQTIAVRGFKDIDGSITNSAPGTFVGSKEEALNTNQLWGSTSFQPGWDVHLGWRFQGGVVVELDWKHLVQGKKNASASILPPTFNVGDQLQNTFLYAPVTNFTPDWAGNPQNIPQGNPNALYGIWNGASIMEIQFIQRFDLYQINVRMPMWETADFRTYGIFGPRIAWIWDQFRWRTADADVNGIAGPATTALYSNYVSNRMYGVHFGGGNDWFLGTTPIGGFSFTLEGEAGLYANLVKARAAYELADRTVSSSRSRRLSSLVPSLEARVGLTWWPWEAISISIGYDVMMFFNTIASTQPVDTNLGIIDPQYSNYFFRWYYGGNASISFVF